MRIEEPSGSKRPGEKKPTGKSGGKDFEKAMREAEARQKEKPPGAGAPMGAKSQGPGQPPAPGQPPPPGEPPPVKGGQPSGGQRGSGGRQFEDALEGVEGSYQTMPSAPKKSPKAPIKEKHKEKAQPKQKRTDQTQTQITQSQSQAEAAAAKAAEPTKSANPVDKILQVFQENPIYGSQVSQVQISHTADTSMIAVQLQNGVEVHVEVMAGGKDLNVVVKGLSTAAQAALDNPENQAFLQAKLGNQGFTIHQFQTFRGETPAQGPGTSREEGEGRSRGGREEPGDQPER